jgi:hypothetical protein
MSGLMSRNKGKRSEREIVNLLQPIITSVYDDHIKESGYVDKSLEVPVLQRNSIQSDRGGYDIVGLDWLAIEVKHQETFNLTNWWEQTVRQAGKKMPVLFYRRNNVAWRVRTWGVLFDAPCRYAWTQAVVDISIEDFLKYFTMRLKTELAK